MQQLRLQVWGIFGFSFFLLQMLNKKYALPHRVIDALVDHFCKFEGEERALPVIWHQSLLTFVQRYAHSRRNPRTLLPLNA